MARKKKASKKEKDFIDYWAFAKKISEEVDAWPEHKKAGMERLLNNKSEPERQHCGCGYVDCNNRGY